MDEHTIVIDLATYNQMLIMCSDYQKLVDHIKSLCWRRGDIVTLDGFRLIDFLEMTDKSFSEFMKTVPDETVKKEEEA